MGLPRHLGDSPSKVIVKVFSGSKSASLKAAVAPGPLQKDLAARRFGQNISLQCLEIIEHLLVLVTGISGRIGALILKEGIVITSEIDNSPGVIILKVLPESVTTCQILSYTQVKALTTSYFPKHHVRIMDIGERVADAEDLNHTRGVSTFRKLELLRKCRKEKT